MHGIFDRGKVTAEETVAIAFPSFRFLFVFPILTSLLAYIFYRALILRGRKARSGSFSFRYGQVRKLFTSNCGISIPLTAVLLMLISPAVTIGVTALDVASPLQLARTVCVPLLIFLVPVVFFYRNIRLYFYLLLPLVIATPFFIFSTCFFALTPGFEMVAFIMQTNPREVREAAGPLLPYFIPFEIAFVGLYVYAVQKIPIGNMRFESLGPVSAASFLVIAIVTVCVNDLFGKPPAEIRKYDLVLRYEFPVSVASGLYDAVMFLKRNNIEKADDFVFHATKRDHVGRRQVYVIIIGESSRYDHWQINGYARPTCPRLSKRSGLILYSDAVAGAHYTWMSVPQIITRADPEHYNLQYREKSIVAAFHEAGFKTAWLSNQSDQDIFWSGTITLHAKTADVAVFSPTYSPNMEFENVYDGRLLPVFDSLLGADERDLFIVLHTMGNHWEYSRRYPPAFDRFRPSGYTHDISPPVEANRVAIVNSYDNSILYADFFIDSVIGTVDSLNAVAAVVFVSDHGEDLFDSDVHQLDFHFRPSAATLKIPLFIWTSPEYNDLYYLKRNWIEANAGKKIGAGNLFHTMLDIANIRVDGFDSTKSFSCPYFLERPQKYYNDDRQAVAFSEIVKTGKEK